MVKKFEHPFVPHFTIAQGLTSQEFEDIFGQVELVGVDLKEKLKNFHYYAMTKKRINGK